MRCPLCKSASKVIDSRELARTNTIRRRRSCLNDACNHRFTTKEMFDDDVQQVRQANELREALYTILGRT